MDQKSANVALGHGAGMQGTITCNVRVVVLPVILALDQGPLVLPVQLRITFKATIVCWIAPSVSQPLMEILRLEPALLAQIIVSLVPLQLALLVMSDTLTITGLVWLLVQPTQ